MSPESSNFTAEELPVALRVAVADPRLVNFVVPEDAAVTGVNLTLQLPGLDPKEAEAAVAVSRILMADNAFQEASMKRIIGPGSSVTSDR